MVFLIYLYQRYLYPVDKSRVDVSGMIEESPDSKTGEVAAGDAKKKESKKNK